MGRLKNKAEHTSRRMPLFCRVVTFLWMGLIFAFSAQDASGSSQLSGQTAFHAAFWFWPGFSGLSAESQAVWVESVQFLVRKAAHFSFIPFWAYCCTGILSLPAEVSEKKWDGFGQQVLPMQSAMKFTNCLCRDGAVRCEMYCWTALVWRQGFYCHGQWKSYTKRRPLMRPLNGLKRESQR